MAGSQAVHLTVSPDEAYLVPGGQQEVALTVHNAGSSVERYHLDVSGLPAEWYDLDQPSVTLPPAAVACVHLAMHAPAGTPPTAGSYPITVHVTSEDDPAHRAAVDFVLTVGSGGGVDMDVEPAAVTGQEATFCVAFLNQSQTSASMALTARDSEDGLDVHIAPADPVLVPTGATAGLSTVYVIPKVRKRIGRPHTYEIEFRARHVGREQAGSPDLVAQARFTYVPRSALQRPVWLRRLPVSTLALMLTLLLVLLIQAYLAAQPTVTPSALGTPASPTVAPQPTVVPQQALATVQGVRTSGRPSIQSFTLVQASPSLPYNMLVWQTYNAPTVTLNGQPVAAQGRRVLYPPLHSAAYQLVARSGNRRVTAQVQIAVRADTSGTQSQVSTASPGTQSVVLVLPRIVTFALQRRMGKLFVVWQVQHATKVWLQAQAVASSGERIVPPGASDLWLTVSNAVGSEQRSLHLPLPTAIGAPIPTASGTPVPTAIGAPIPTASGTPVPAASGTPVPAASGTPVPAASGTTLPAAGGTPVPTAVGTSMSTAAASPPAIVLIPDLLSFGTQDVNTRSAAQDLHIVNLGPTALTIAGVTIGGANPHDFNAPDTCAGATIRVYNGCTIRVSFTPSLDGPRRASLVIADNAVNSPQIVPLSGTGRRPLG